MTDSETTLLIAFAGALAFGLIATAIAWASHHHSRRRTTG